MLLIKFQSFIHPSGKGLNSVFLGKVNLTPAYLEQKQARHVLKCHIQTDSQECVLVNQEDLGFLGMRQ